MQQYRRYRHIKQLAAIAALTLYLIMGAPAQAMHIMEGFLPVKWAVFWWAISLPFFVVGVRSLTRSLSRPWPSPKSAPKTSCYPPRGYYFSDRHSRP